MQVRKDGDDRWGVQPLFDHEAGRGAESSSRAIYRPYTSPNCAGLKQEKCLFGKLFFKAVITYVLTHAHL